MSQPEFTRRGVIATSVVAGGAVVAGGQLRTNAVAATVTSSPSTGNSPVADRQPGTVPGEQVGNAGELHQVATGSGDVLTTNQGVPLGDDQNSLKVGTRGPVLLEDFILREKINHFDHERFSPTRWLVRVLGPVIPALSALMTSQQSELSLGRAV